MDWITTLTLDTRFWWSDKHTALTMDKGAEAEETPETKESSTLDSTITSASTYDYSKAWNSKVYDSNSNIPISSADANK